MLPACDWEPCDEAKTLYSKFSFSELFFSRSESDLTVVEMIVLSNSGSIRLIRIAIVARCGDFGCGEMSREIGEPNSLSLACDAIHVVTGPGVSG